MVGQLFYKITENNTQNASTNSRLDNYIMFAKVTTAASLLASTATAAVSRVDPTTVGDLVNDGKFDVIVDARSNSEFLRSRLPGAVTVSDVPEECFTKDITIGVYCYTGWDRSTPAAYYMDSQITDGESKVYDLGGIQVRFLH